MLHSLATLPAVFAVHAASFAPSSSPFYLDIDSTVEHARSPTARIVGIPGGFPAIFTLVWSDTLLMAAHCWPALAGRVWIEGIGYGENVKGKPMDFVGH
jgi:hypothetical protein